MKAYRLDLKTVDPDPPLKGVPPESIDQRSVRYADLVETVLRSPRPGQGIPKPEQKIRNRIRRSLRETNGALLLSVEEHTLLADLVEHYPWGLASFAVEQFCDDVAQCERVSVGPVQAVPDAQPSEAVS